ncbi:MAG: hypothetical protein AAF791_06720 [Bacteroidota bacterium]
MSALSPTPSTALQAAAGLIASGRPEAAARELTALVHAAPTYAAAHVLLAKAREASGDRVRALEAWHRAYFLVPSSPLVRRERQRLLDALAPPEAEAIADEAPAVRADEPETAALLPPMAAPEAAPPPPPPETDWDVVDEHDEDGSEAFPAPPSRPVAPDLVPPGDDRVPAPGTPTGPPPTDAVEVPSELDDDLDSLIRDLEDAPRIQPDPEYDGPEERGAEAAVDEVASETLAKIYAAQQQYAEAAVVYEKLARQSPGRAAELQKQAEEMRRRAS